MNQLDMFLMSVGLHKNFLWDKISENSVSCTVFAFLCLHD